MLKNQLNKKIVFIFLFLMCTQFIPIEGQGVSSVKFSALCLTPFIWMLNFQTFSKAFVWGILYVMAIIFSALYNIDSFRLETFGYKVTLVVMFIMYYDLIHISQALNLSDYIRFLRTLILAYFIILILQQAAIILGINSLPIINYMGSLNRGIGSNSLAIEPSHSARILSVLMLMFIRMYKLQLGRKSFGFLQFYIQNKLVVIGFLWAMITMGSATAFVALGILSLYFLNKSNFFKILAVLFVFYNSINYINYEPLNRAKNVFESSMTLDQEEVIEADGSASRRIVPLLNTLAYLNLESQDAWLGKGIDSNRFSDFVSEDNIITEINDYGLICYIILLIFFFSTCLIKLLSIESLFFVFLLGMTISNIAYAWGILMLFTTSKYFLSKKV